MTRNIFEFNKTVRMIIYAIYAVLLYAIYGVVTHSLGVGTWNLW